MKKRIGSLVLALVLCLGLTVVPAAALNAGEEWMGDFVVLKITEGYQLIKYYGEDSAVTIPSNITAIGNGAFKGCTSLESVTIPSGVTSIGEAAFAGCTNLKSVTIPSGVTVIKSGTFSGCTGLTSVNIPSGVTRIDNNAFYNCTGLKSVTIPSGVTFIGSSAFHGCTGLTSVTIPGSVARIDQWAFRDCTGLTSVTLTEGMGQLGSNMFQGCTGLTTVTIPGSVHIYTAPFSGCTGLKSVTILDGVTEISERAFTNCTGLTSVTIPLSVDVIRVSAFDYCAGLTDIYYAGTKAQWNAIAGWDITMNRAKANPTIHYNSTGPSTTAPTQPQQPAANTAYASTQNVLVDGRTVEFQCYALKDANGNDTNYIKLRDIASVLNGTAAQFEVAWDGAVNIVTGQPYTANGSEMSTPFSGSRAYEAAAAPTNVNGAAASLEAIVLKDDAGGAYTYYKLRDLGAALGFTVDWSAEKGIFIETT